MLSSEFYCVFAGSQLYAVCTSLTSVKQCVSKGILSEAFCFGDASKKTFEQQEREFRKAWNEAVKNDTIEYVLKHVKHCRVESIIPNKPKN